MHPELTPTTGYHQLRNGEIIKVKPGRYTLTEHVENNTNKTLLASLKKTK